MATSRSFGIARLFAAAVIACSAAAAFVVYAARRVTGYVLDAFTVAVGMFKRSDPHFPERQPEVQERIGLVAAKAFLLRLAQRPRPQDTQLWRMSPAN